MSRECLVFDLNGTLLDVSSLDELFALGFGSSDVRHEWFDRTIQLAMTSALTGYFEEFRKLAESALQAVAERHDVRLSPALTHSIVQRLQSLPAYPDCVPAFDRLQNAGYRMSVLTNISQASAESMVRAVGLEPYFDSILSVEAIQTYKPAPEAYQYAAHALGTELSAITLIAAHSWDTTGAMRAGCRAVFLQRPGEVLERTAPQPRVVAHLYELADSLLKAA